MQVLQIEEYTNEAGWYIEHDPETHLYRVRRESGHFLSGAFTSRRFAEAHLRKYLDGITRKARKQAEEGKNLPKAMRNAGK